VSSTGTTIARARRLLIAPSPSLTDVADRRHAELLAALVLTIVLLGTVSGVVQWLLVPRFAGTLARMLGALTLLTVAYALSRTHRYRAAAVLAALLPAAACYLVAIDNPADHVWYGFCLLGVVVSAALLPVRQAVTIALVIVAGVVAVCLAIESLRESQRMVPVLALVGILSSTVLVATAHRDRVERERHRDEQRRARLLAEAQHIARVGHFAIPRSSDQLEISAVLLDMLGEPAPRSLAELVARIHPDERDAFACQLRRDGAGPRSVHHRIVRPDGETLCVHTAAVVCDESDALLGVMRDVTREAASDAERRRLEAKLHEALRLETVGHLAATVAHDFNNLLTVILFNARRLADGEDRERAMADVDAAGERAAALTRQLLAFARGRESAARLHDLNAIVRGMLRLLECLAHPQVALRVQLAPALPAVRVDADKIERVLLNLVGNARDAMPAGGVITIRTGVAQSGEERRVVLSVQDTGTGMDDETRARAFEPYFSTKEPGRGTGLGLAIVRQIVEQNGGTIDVRSELRRGTTVALSLPPVAEARAGMP
jgi:signal transduction histidine kinase